MQTFSGFNLVCILLLVSLSLTVIFGLMGVINMAHGEFLAIGAYSTYVTSIVIEAVAPGIMPGYIFLAIPIAFVVAAIVGLVVEFSLIRFLYRRPLDTLLATWGLSIVMQQLLRNIFGGQEVTVPVPAWLFGALEIGNIFLPLNGFFVIGLTLVVTLGLLLFLYRTRWGLKIRATTQREQMAEAVGINTRGVYRLTFALGCGIAGTAGAAFTLVGSTSPTAGSLYLVDSFLVVTFGGIQSIFGTMLSSLLIGESLSITEFFMSGSTSKVVVLLTVVIIILFRPQGLIASAVRK